ncbi:hypothetical protein ABB37_04645 [Leptomonas pyrrhocoris]|uniref:Uncharacterized protein n=1 Tax=Leptomonas pyrrhocoris TaxID=157538 RepID=A0A0M9G1Q9_LEPPY|nr:hypothetical protein ABB37_04645 [Leptomonas pyrrhocoris]KPA80399.1 hypothetical protein ABB37_04645 [Leptomonas pyrrhocoris]|eukprot:XP_015658838.1 hypothetical protein ABB37_04645 [Leptomonas pyrrhocoris]
MLHRRPTLRSSVVRGTSVSVTFKGLGTYDYPSAFTWPPPQDETAGSENGSARSHGPRPPSTAPSSSPNYNNSDDYVTHYRSPFSVLRSRQSRVNRCAAGMLGSSFDTSTRYLLGKSSKAPCAQPYCCCSALLYPATFAAQTEAAERVRDDFVWSLKLGGVEDLLRTTLGVDLHTRLRDTLGAPPVTAAVLSCSDPTKMAQLMSHTTPSAVAGDTQAGNVPVPSNADPANAAFIARLLLSADEDNRIRWLQEESASMELADYYSRAPSLRALFILWSLLQHQQRVRGAAVRGSSVGGGDESRYGGDRDGGDGDRWGEVSRYDGADGPRMRGSPSSLTPCPKMSEIRHVLLRMEERRVEVMMSDIAALAAIGTGGTGSTAIPDGDFWDSLAKMLKPQEVAAALHTSSSSTAPSLSSPGHTTTMTVAEEALGLQHILLLCLLLRYVLLVRAEAAQRDATLSQPPSTSTSALASQSKLPLPIAAFAAVSSVIRLRKALTAAPAEGGANVADVAQRTSSAVIQDVIVVLSDVVLKHAYEMAETSHVPASSPHLPELTTWLLREMVSSPVCEFHFKRLVDRSITEALVALEKSGLVNRSTIDLKVVVRQLLPLLESCSSEDLYTSVLRDVLSALEEKARRDGYAFSAEDLQYLAELGTKLFSSGPSDSTTGGYGLHDETVRAQMEELHVMDGSPWALCVSSYRSLKEMLQGIVRDQRRLKEQVQDQLRQLSNASTLSAVMSGSGGETEAEATKDTSGTAKNSKAQHTPSSESSVHDITSSASTAAAPLSGQAGQSEGERSSAGGGAAQDARPTPAAPPRIPVPPILRQRFLNLIEELVKSQVDESSAHSEKPIVVSSELFAFVTQHVPVPNIQDEYRRKIFLLVNVAEDPATTRQRIAQRREERRRRLRAEATAGPGGAERLRRRIRKPNRGDAVSAEEEENARCNPVDMRVEKGEKDEADADPHGGANDIPAELRLLVSSLPLTLSPWASVMILREVLAESAGRNPRYTYVLNAAIDLQLPISTTRSRIATTLNMWRFLNTQSHKLSLKESLVMKQRCAWNLPLSYILSSYWSLLTWLALASIVALNVVGIDWESQIVASSLFRMFAPWEEICATPPDEESAGETWTKQAAADLAADYFEQAEIADRRREEHRRSSTNVFLSSASYLVLGYDDQRRPMTVIPIGSDGAASAEERAAEEYAAATAVLRELSLHAPFPFFVDIERALPIELVETRIADRIRRVSFNNTWFLPRMIIRTFPLGRHYTEHKLILHTCTQANLTRRRVTFLLYMHDGVAVTPQFIQKLNESYLSKHANLVLVMHESSLRKGGTTPASLAKISQSSVTTHGAGVSVGSVESVASAAADMMESVLPDEVREAAFAAAYAGVAPDQQVRVLPLCRQYYTNDGTMVSEAMRVKMESAGTSVQTTAAAAEETSGWWHRLMSYVHLHGSSSSRPAAAETAASLPLFASAFSAQRASLRRSHEQQSDDVTSNTSRNASFSARAAQWWKQTLFDAVAPDSGVKRAEDKKEENTQRRDAPNTEHTPTLQKTETTTTSHAAPTAERHSHADYPSGFQDDAVEDRAGRNVVSVSFTALRRLMAEVSAPVPIPRKKHSSNSSSNAATRGSLSSTAGVTGCEEGRDASPPHDAHALSHPAPHSSSSPEEGWRRFWSVFYGRTTAAPAIAEENAEAPTASSTSAPTPQTTQESSASSSSAPPPPSPHVSPLSFSSMPTADLARQNGSKWEGEWQKTDEMLAQLRRTTGANA